MICFCFFILLLLAAGCRGRANWEIAHRFSRGKRHVGLRWYEVYIRGGVTQTSGWGNESDDLQMPSETRAVMIQAATGYVRVGVVDGKGVATTTMSAATAPSNQCKHHKPNKAFVRNSLGLSTCTSIVYHKIQKQKK